MKEADRERLLLKKQILQQKLQVSEAVQALERWWLPWYDLVVQQNIPHEVVYINCVDQADLPLWEEALQQAPLNAYYFSTAVIKTPAKLFVHMALNSFENKHPLRYLPDLEKQSQFDDPLSILHQAAPYLSIRGEDSVYFFLNRFTPVLQLPFGQLLQHTELLYELPEDVCILPPSFEWLIFRSLEEEWRWGKKQGH